MFCDKVAEWVNFEFRIFEFRIGDKVGNGFWGFAEILKMFLADYAEILKIFLAEFAEILKMFGFEHRFNGLFMLHQYPPPAQTWCAAYLRFVHPIQRRFWKDLWFSMVLLLFYCI